MCNLPGIQHEGRVTYNVEAKTRITVAGGVDTP